MDISDKELQASLNRTEERRQRAREIRRRQMRKFALGVLAVFIVVGALVLGITAGGDKQMPPAVLAVIWPHGENEDPLSPQHVTHGTTLLVKQGQPLKVALPEPEKWNGEWVTADVKNVGESFDWTPAGAEAKLTAHVKAKLSGWKQLLAWRWPTREIILLGRSGSTPAAAAVSSSGFLQEIDAPAAGIWMHFRTIARATRVRFDYRAIKAYGEAAEQLGSPVADAATADTEVWQLIPSFDGESPAPADSGTYALLKTSNPAADARQAFRILDRLAPGATIKVIVDEAENEARFRLSFDDKAQRYVWVKTAGAGKAEPQDWLEN